MYDNIGEKLKITASTISTAGICVSVVLGIIMLIFGCVNNSFGWVMVGIAGAIIGSIISWLSMTLIYGFGHLIVKVDALEKAVKNQYKEALNESNPSIITNDDSKEVDQNDLSQKYICLSIKKTGIHSRGKCEVCGIEVTNLELCHINKGSDTNKLDLCPACKNEFLRNSSK